MNRLCITLEVQRHFELMSVKMELGLMIYSYVNYIEFRCEKNPVWLESSSRWHKFYDTFFSQRLKYTSTLENN